MPVLPPRRPWGVHAPAHAPRRRGLPAMPWVELLGFLVLIALAAARGA